MHTLSANDVPRGTRDPIQFLLNQGETPVTLATAWGFRTTDSIYRLKRFAHVPPPDTAALMGRSFGWTAGQVIDHWMERVKR